MAEFNQNLELLPYNQIKEAQDRWSDFFFAELSSIYSDTSIKSSNYSTIIKVYSRIVAISEIFFDKTVEDNFLSSVKQDLLYQNFGYLLNDKPSGFSAEDYRTFLLTLINLLFKGLSINIAKNEAATSLGALNLTIFSPNQLRNTSFPSHGLNHLNSLGDTLNKATALILDTPSETSLDLSYRGIDTIIISSSLEQVSDINISVMNVLTEVINLISSATVEIEPRVVCSDNAGITSSSTVSVVRIESDDNFTTISDSHQYI